MGGATVQRLELVDGKLPPGAIRVRWSESKGCYVDTMFGEPVSRRFDEQHQRRGEREPVGVSPDQPSADRCAEPGCLLNRDHDCGHFSADTGWSDQ